MSANERTVLGQTDNYCFINWIVPRISQLISLDSLVTILQRFRLCKHTKRFVYLKSASSTDFSCCNGVQASLVLSSVIKIYQINEYIFGMIKSSHLKQ